MCKCLYTRNQFDPEFCSIPFHLPDLFFRVASSERSKMRIFWNLICIFRVKKKIIHSKKRQIFNVPFDCPDFKHSISGTVEHRPKPARVRGLRAGNIFLRISKHHPKRPVILNILVVLNFDVVSAFQHPQSGFFRILRINYQLFFRCFRKMFQQNLRSLLKF